MVDNFQSYNLAFASGRSVEDLLNSAATLYGLLLSFDPSVVELARNEMYEEATISTNPTDRGVREIDTAHSLFGLHVLTPFGLND